MVTSSAILPLADGHGALRLGYAGKALVAAIGATDQFVPFIVIARPIGAEQVHHGFSAP